MNEVKHRGFVNMFKLHNIDFLACLCLSNKAEDLRLLMQKMENWAHRLFPKLQFENFIDKVEKLGAKKEVQVR